MAGKNNDVLEEQINMIFKMLEDNKRDYMGIFSEIKKMLADIKNDSVTKDQLDSALKLHEAQSKARHDQQEVEIVIIKRVVYGALIAMVGALWQNFVSLFSLIIK